jgi:hypothetical protein
MIVGIQTRLTSMMERKLLLANSTQSFQALIFHGIIARKVGSQTTLKRSATIRCTKRLRSRLIWLVRSIMYL